MTVFKGTWHVSFLQRLLAEGHLTQHWTPCGVYWAEVGTVLAQTIVPVSVQAHPVLLLACHPSSFPKAFLQWLAGVSVALWMLWSSSMQKMSKCENRRVLMYASFGQLSCMLMMAFPQPFFCHRSCRWCWDVMADWVGAIILHRKSNIAVTFLKHLKNECYQVVRLMVPSTFQNMNSVLKDLKHNWLKPLNTGKFETCLPQYHFHNNLNSFPKRNAPLDFVRVFQSAPFPNLWTIKWDAGVLWGHSEALPCLGKRLSWSQMWWSQSYVSLLTCPTPMEYGLHRCPWWGQKMRA